MTRATDGRAGVSFWLCCVLTVRPWALVPCLPLGSCVKREQEHNSLQDCCEGYTRHRARLEVGPVCELRCCDPYLRYSFCTGQGGALEGGNSTRRCLEGRRKLGREVGRVVPCGAVCRGPVSPSLSPGALRPPWRVPGIRKESLVERGLWNQAASFNLCGVLICKVGTLMVPPSLVCYENRVSVWGAFTH